MLSISSFIYLYNYYYFIIAFSIITIIFLSFNSLFHFLLYDTSGSSVCTSLVEGESMLHPKGMGLLHIRRNKQFRLDSIPFTQIRPFLYGDLSLHNVKGNLELSYLISFGLLIKISHNLQDTFFFRKIIYDLLILVR